MTITAAPQHPGRTRPAGARVYTTPVVRPLPPRPVENLDSRIW